MTAAMKKKEKNFVSNIGTSVLSNWSLLSTGFPLSSQFLKDAKYQQCPSVFPIIHLKILLMSLQPKKRKTEKIIQNRLYAMEVWHSNVSEYDIQYTHAWPGVTQQRRRGSMGNEPPSLSLLHWQSADILGDSTTEVAAG